MATVHTKKARRRSLVLAMQLVDSAIAMQKEAPPPTSVSLRTAVSSDGATAKVKSGPAAIFYQRARRNEDLLLKQRAALMASANAIESSSRSRTVKPQRRATMGGRPGGSAVDDSGKAENSFGSSSQLLGALDRRCEASPDGNASITKEEISILRDALYGAVHLNAAAIAAGQRAKEEDEEKKNAAPSEDWQAKAIDVEQRATNAFTLGSHLAKSGPSASIMAKLRGWDFDVFQTSEELERSNNNSYVVLGFGIFKDSGLLSCYKIDAVTLCNFLFEIRAGYIDSNPYHNSLHGIDVAQTMHYFLHVAGLASKCSDWERLAAITAALVHDMGHFTLNNGFLNNTDHPLALTYNYKSALENMHVSNALKVLAKSGCNFMEGLQLTDVANIRKLMIELVLATDMATHAPNLKALEAGLDSSEADLETKLVLKNALHAADISNPAKPWEYYQTWTDRVLKEFFDQGDKERALGLPISMGFDREKAKTQVDRARGQLGFIGYVVKPLYDIFARVPQIDLSTSATMHLAENSQRWKQIIAESQA